MRIDWYFDFLSPFAYLQLVEHADLLSGSDARLRPVLLAAILDHHGQRGPAEIPAKRLHTYRLVQWLASARGIPLRFPPAHPFNPLKLLRLAIALGSTPEVVRTIFDFLWRDGHSADEDWTVLLARLGVADDAPLIADPQVKVALRANTDDAIAAGVFGVPSFVVDGQVFWGEDATPMLRAYLADRTLFDSEEMQRIAKLPVAASRL